MTKQFSSASLKKIQGNKITGAIGSTPSIDRDGDIVDPLGIDVRNFKNNPQLLWGHDASRFPIGKVTDVRISERGLEFDAVFASDIDPFAKQAFNMVKGGFLSSFSIGFMIKERDSERITQSELLEISLVNIPANSDARVSRQYKSFNAYVANNRGPTKLSKHQKKIKLLNTLLKK